MYAIKQALHALGSPAKAKNVARFFKTKKGDYGEGDRFIGVTMPEQRTLAQRYATAPLITIRQLLHDPYHECRMTALLILINHYTRAPKATKQSLFTFYLDHTYRINNWDLVDVSAPHIVGKHLLNRDTAVLYDLAHSSLLWDRRIAIVSTHWFIRHNQFTDTLKLAALLLHDDHDLMHKAVGWMLREVGNRDQVKTETFLKKHKQTMPRTMLRYAIERFPKQKRAYFMRK